ncbi:MAG TPA: alpha/beta hydrolase [Rugosimonospora sp.]|nr:alpha/beta hydrolase [Rugosimonospora sp.]
MESGILPVPGAAIYYEVRGSGPVLLLICGGVYDADGYAGLAGQLADRYTVVTYDRRGNSRSAAGVPREPQRIEVHADDAYRVLHAVGVAAGGPAYVFGNSSGAEIGLELAARHPELVRTLIAHEPPIFDLLPDAGRLFDLMGQVEEVFAAQGPGPAMQVFGAGLAMRGGEPEDERVPGGAQAPPEPDPAMLAMMARMEQNMAFFIGYEVPPFGRYTADLAALRGSGVRIVPAVGAESVDEPPHRSALALAERLGVKAVTFPGDHGGFGSHVPEFARLLDEVLSGT